MKVTTIRSRFRIKRRSYTQFLFLSVLAISYFSGVSAAPPSTEYEVCDTEKCRELANVFRSGMNETINRCDDFYEYVCGNWAETHPIPRDYFSWSNFDIIINQTNNHLREILDSASIDGESTSIQKAKQLYKSCIDTNATESEGVTVLMKYINETGGWPIIMRPGEWEKSKKPWQSVDSEYSLIMGTSSIIQLDMILNDDNSSHTNVFIGYPPGLENVPPQPNSSNLDDFYNKPLTANHIRFIKEIARIMARAQGSGLDENLLEQDARGIIRFESNLAAISSYPIDEAYLAAKNYSQFDLLKLFPNATIAVLQEYYNSWGLNETSTAKIDWLKRIQEFFAPANSITVTSSDLIRLDDPSYLILLPELLNGTAERDIVNTIQWWFVKRSLNYLNQEMIEIFEKYSKGDFPVVGNRKKRPIPQSRSLRCVVENKLKHPLAFAYVQTYFPEGTIKPVILRMFNEMKLEMRNEISQSKWLDMESKHATMEKLDKMAMFIGYPDWYKNSTVLNEGYEELSIGSSYFKNVLLIERFIIQQTLKSIGKANGKTTLLDNPLTVNAYYQIKDNAVCFPAGFLQMPFFDTDYPDPINYGWMGSVIGHEITHGFDSFGSRFDKDGNLTDIWSANTTQEFRNRTQPCFIDQFNGYGGNGKKTLNEDIADSAGIRTSFEAFKRHMNNSHNRDVKLPGLEEFSAEQLYFLSYAARRCRYARPEFHALFNADKHSPADLRVRGPLSNFEGFSETFNCPKGSGMNPLKKCSLWQ